MIELNGISILVTRPHPSGEALCHHIIKQGGLAVHFPTIVFGPPEETDAFQTVAKALPSQEWLIFISPQAVHASIPALSQMWPHFPSQLKLAAVGAGTAKALEDADYKVAAYPKTQWNSEGLLDLPDFQTIAGKQITIVRGEGGRDELEKKLIARGAKISHLVAYQRLLPKIDVYPIYKLFKQHKIDVMMASSCQGVRNFKILLHALPWSYIKDIPLIVVSERIKNLALDLDFQPIWVAQNASHEAILQILAERRSEICQIKQMKRLSLANHPSQKK